MGGIVGAYQSGGMVGNGTYNVDSVRARYAGGGDILLAGGEHVTRATSVTAQTAPWLDYVNRMGELPGIASPANDWWQAASNDRLPASVPSITPPPPPRPSGGGSDRTAAEIKELTAAVKKLTAVVERSTTLDQDQRAAIAEGMADILERVADATETTAKKKVI